MIRTRHVVVGVIIILSLCILAAVLFVRTVNAPSQFSVERSSFFWEETHAAYDTVVDSVREAAMTKEAREALVIKAATFAYPPEPPEAEVLVQTPTPAPVSPAANTVIPATSSIPSAATTSPQDTTNGAHE